MKYLKIFEEFNESILIWIHGLPGSGKSTLSKSISKKVLENWIILDDINSVNTVIETLSGGNNVILTSPYFETYTKMGLNQKLLDGLGKLNNIKLVEIWFENDVKSCINNLQSRKNHNIPSKVLIQEIHAFSSIYRIPNGAITVPVWSPDNYFDYDVFINDFTEKI